MTDRELMQQALEALQKIYIAPEHEEYIRVWWPACEQAITALQERLAQPEQEQVKFKCTVVDDDHPNGIPIEQWSIPSIRKPLVGLTELELRILYVSTSDYKTLWESIEAKLREKNT